MKTLTTHATKPWAGLTAAVLLCVLNLFFNSTALAGDDLGVAGKTWQVIERNFLDVIKEQVQASIDNGKWQKMLDEREEQMKQYAKRPPGQKLPLAKQNNKRLYNPTLVMPEDVLDHEGRILFRAGTSVNPLDVMPLTRIMMLFDADSAKQLEWAKSYFADYQGDKLLVPILVDGSVEDATKALKQQVFFDQGQYLIGYYGVNKLPSLIYQAELKDKYLTIEEVGL